jgi:hypothetical protein
MLKVVPADWNAARIYKRQGESHTERGSFQAFRMFDGRSLV